MSRERVTLSADIFAKKQLTDSAKAKPVNIASEPHSFICLQCGSAMIYTVGQLSISCSSCAYSESIETLKTGIGEYPLDIALRDIKLKPLMAPLTEIKCGTCGAVSTWDVHRLSGECSYCQTPLAKLDTDNNRLQIEAIVPFTIKKTDAVKLLSKWMGNRWFAPNVLKEMSGHSKQFEGVYVPHWTFDSLTHTDYTGQRGEHYIVYERQMRVVQGKQKMVEVPITKTRWYHASGQVRVMFDDVLVLASMLIPKVIVNQLRPWQLDHAEPYTPEYLAGMKSDYYQLDLDEAFQVAKARMASEIHHAILRDIGGDAQQVHSKRTNYQNSTYKLVMLPVWYSAFEYKGKMYQTVINGQTGRVAGQYPKSVGKIILATIAGIIALVFAFYAFNEMNQISYHIQNQMQHYS